MSKCFRESGFPTAEYAQRLEMSASSLVPNCNTLYLGISIDDSNTTTLLHAIMKQFRTTVPSFADASIQHVNLLLQGSGHLTNAEICPRSRPSLHLFVALWKQTSLSFAPDHVDGNQTAIPALTRPTLEVADFIITDFGRMRLFNFVDRECSPTRLYSGTLWIELTVPDSTRVKLTLPTPSHLKQIHSVEAPLCGRCGQFLTSDNSKIERRCSSCHGRPRICERCYLLRPMATLVDAYVMEMEACTIAHPFAFKVKSFLEHDLDKVSCNCDCSSWS